MSDPLAGFPVVVDIPVAWGEMDAFGHVNNVMYFRYFETAAQVTESGFLMHYLAVSERHGKIAAEGTGRIVSFDYRRGVKSPLQPEIAGAIARLEAGAGS